MDEHAEAGGTLLSEPQAIIESAAAWDWLAATLADLKTAGVKVMTRTTAIGYYHENFIGMVERLTDHLDTVPEDTPRERMWRMRAKQVVLAQGALEKPLVFHGNDRPGVMLAGSAQTFLNRFGVLVGKRPVVLTSHDSAWYTAFDLAGAGARVTIEQDAIRVTHAQSAQDYVALGRDVEAQVLSRAIHAHAHGRVLLNGNRTIVFPAGPGEFASERMG